MGSAAKKLDPAGFSGLDFSELVYRSVLGIGGTSVIHEVEYREVTFALKVAHPEYDITDELRKSYYREAMALARITHGALVRLYDVGEHEGRPYLLLEKIEGQTLDKKISQGLDVTTTLDFAIQLVEVLKAVHEHSVVHRDIKPSNILIENDNRVRLIDFGFGCDFEQQAKGGLIGAGSVEYMSPEQSGTHQRPVDVRSDLYSVGVVLFECLIGRVPFQTTNLPDLLQMHAMEKPPKITELRPDLPVILSEIVDKLLQKDPDDRYQSAHGLLGDLQKTREAFASGVSRIEFPLGQHDSRFRGQGLQFVGRKAELEQLAVSLRSAKAGTGSFAFITGPSGIGKTWLARQAFLKSGGSGFLAVGKCVRGDPLPFSVIRDCLESLHATAKSGGNASTESLYKAVRDAAGENQSLLKRFSPLLGRAFSEVEAKSDWGDEIFDVFTDFFLKLSSNLGFLSVMIDDIQWVDQGSLEIIRRIEQYVSGRHLWIVCTSRDDEDSEQRLKQVTGYLTKSISVSLSLSPLDLDDVRAILRTYLGPHEIERDAVKVIAQHCQGYPFAVGEIAALLCEQKVLVYHFGHWSLDKAGLTTATLSVNLIDLNLNRMKSLPESAILVLAVASVFGGMFRPKGLQFVCEKLGFRGHVQAAIQECLSLNLFQQENDEFLSFAHDSIFEASQMKARSVLNERVANQAAGDYLYQEFVASEDRSHLFKIAKLYLRGTEENPRRTYEVNFEAGLVALDSFANALAKDFFTSAAEVAGKSGLPLDARFYRLSAKACANAGDIDGALRRIDSSIQCAQTAIERAEANQLATDIFLFMNDTDKAQKYTLRGFAELNIQLPDKIWHLPVSFAMWVVGMIIEFIHPGGLVKDPVRRYRSEVVAKFYMTAMQVMFYKFENVTFMNLGLRSIFASSLVPPSRGKVAIWNGHAILLAALNLKAPALYFSRVSMKMAESIQDRKAIASAKLYYTFVHTFLGDVLTAERLHRENMKDGMLAWLDEADYALGLAELGQNLYRRGYMRQAYDVLYTEFIKKLLFAYDDIEVAHEKMPWLGATGYVKCFLGDATAAKKFLGTSKRLTEAYGYPPFMASNLVKYYLAMYSELDEIESEDIEGLIDSIERMCIHPMLFPLHQREVFLFISEMRYKQLIKSSPEEAPQKLGAFRYALKQLKRASYHAYLRPHYLIMEAAHQIYLGKARKALKGLARAERLAEKIDSPLALYDIAYYRALIHRASGNSLEMSKHVEFAAFLARKFDFVTRLASLQEQFPQDLPKTPSRAIDKSMTGTSVLLESRFKTLQEIGTVIGTGVGPREQISRILDRLLQILSAERAFVFLGGEHSDRAKTEGLTLGRDREGHDFSALEGFSSSVIDEVKLHHHPVLYSAGQRGELDTKQSIMDFNLRSIVATPLMIGNRFVGVLYLDNRLVKGSFSQDDVGLLEAIASHIAVVIESMRIAEVELEKREMEKDLEVTASLQQLFFPQMGKKLSFRDDVFIYGFNRGASQCSGDWWTFSEAKEKIQILVCDVTGHGVASAMVTAGMANVYSLLRRIEENMELGKVLEHLNQSLYMLTKDRYLMVYSGIEVDYEKNVFRVFGAGSPPICHIRPDGTIDFIECFGEILGLREGKISCDCIEIPLLPGERFIVMTDGIVETAVSEGRVIRANQVRKIFEAAKHLPPDEMVNSIIAAIDGLRYGKQSDDYTLVVIGRD